jgi:hypothetical protein
MEARDKRLIMRLAVALADFYGKQLDDKYFAQATRILTHRDAPLGDRITLLDFSGPDVESLVG